MQEIVKKHLRVVNAAGILAVLSILAGSVGLGVVPAYRKGLDNINEARRLHQHLEELNGLTSEINAVEVDRVETEKRLQAAEARLPSSNAMDEFMQQVASVADKAGIQVDAITPLKDVKELKDSDGYRSLPVEIGGTGDWESCYRFLTGLRTMNRLTRLDSVSMDLTKEGKEVQTNHPICRITVNISTFMAR